MIDLFSCSYLLRKKIEIQYNNNMIKNLWDNAKNQAFPGLGNGKISSILLPTPHVRVFIASFKKYIFRQGSYVHRAVGGCWYLLMPASCELNNRNIFMSPAQFIIAINSGLNLWIIFINVHRGEHRARLLLNILWINLFSGRVKMKFDLRECGVKGIFPTCTGLSKTFLTPPTHVVRVQS